MSRRRRPKVDRVTRVAAHIEALSHDGRGIARIDGKTTFVFGALPGEQVMMQYRSHHRQYDEADAVEITEASSQRVVPPCAVFGRCGACVMQHMSPEDQLSHKQAIFVEQLQQYAGAEPEQWLAPLAGPTQHYRRKARLSVREVKKKETVMLGFRERDGRYVTDMEACPILADGIGKHFAALRALLCTLPEKASIPQIEVFSTDQNAIIVRHLEPLSPATVDRLSQLCQTANWWLYLQPGNETTIHKVYPQDEAFLLSYRLPAYDLTLSYAPSGFIQVNDAINQAMIDQIIALLDLGGQETVLDLFCGVGNISLPIARSAARVVGVEAAESAVEQAKNNAIANGIDHAQFVVANLFDDCSAEGWAKEKYDALVLDPPRAGAKEILSLLPVLQPKKIVYVSCHPMTLARDAQLILSYGYHFAKAGVMDMFPHTNHVESIALFEKK